MEGVRSLFELRPGLRAGWAGQGGGFALSWPLGLRQAPAWCPSVRKDGLPGGGRFQLTPWLSSSAGENMTHGARIIGAAMDFEIPDVLAGKLLGNIDQDSPPAKQVHG